jgi:excisionase family DNA binding protein
MAILLSIKQTAPELNCAEVTVRKLIRAGKIGYKKIGSRYFLTQDHIQDFLNRAEVSPIVKEKGGEK